MKKFLLIVITLTISFLATSQEVVTYFDGQSKIYSERETASLYSVKLTNKYTFVTIELSPTKNRSRMNYFTSGFTHIKVGPYYKIRFLGALSNDGNSYHPCEPDHGWGWSNCKPGEKYRYTLVFDGRIPHGYTNFTMVDEYTPYHGYSFRNYKINNPDIVEKTGYNEYSVKQHINDYNDGVVGIYEVIGEEQGYKLGCVKSEDGYKLIFLGGNNRLVWWNQGDLKAYLKATSTPGLYKAIWHLANKDIADEAYVGFDGSSMQVVVGGSQSNYLKTYPAHTDVSAEQMWSGSGIEIERGHIITNYHVVDGAGSIIVQRVVNDREEQFVGEVVATDKVNDLAVIRITDTKYYKYSQLPYSVKFATSDVGESCYALGYPMISTMGTEMKLTTGVISSRSGFQGDVSTYQVSVPVQPGNSGGPLFNYRGELIGIINAKHTNAENVSYAIKTSYVRNLTESFTNGNLFPTANLISSKDLPGQVKSIKPFVYMILCTKH